MDISQQIEAVYRRALLLRQYAVESPVSQELLGKALQELYFVLEELQTSQEELHQQNQALIAAQQTVELEHRRYESLFDLAPNGYLVTDRQGIIEEVNHHAAALFSMAPAFLIHKPLLVLVHPSNRPRFQAQLANLTAEQTWEMTLNPRHGVLITVAIAVARFQDPRRRQEMLLWSLHDITQRQQMERQLQAAHDALEARIAERTTDLAEANSQLKQEFEEGQQAEQKIRDQAAPLDIATDAIFVLALDQRLMFWSQGATRLYGWTTEEILGKSANLLFPQDIFPAFTTGFTQTLEQGFWQAELDQVTQTGNLITVESCWNLVRDTDGQPQSILVANTISPTKSNPKPSFTAPNA